MSVIENNLNDKVYVCSAEPFELGEVVMTQSISSLLEDNVGANLEIYLMRHKNGDWGDTPLEDKLLNDEATRTGERVMSSYKFCGEKIWIITEGDRSVTTILFPIE
ncbi:hypothetical protein MACH09_46780 [Vibrio sp. MACH09]|uniref:type I restriction endonuclease subunit M n=1 Tax=Vibrio sp. MACH09 TaxID=3025122 RepID=UPI002791377E|nr:type I restriction endonuclease subunit M [Vibrio sp. MACH09]GLO64170.1 hypothetical protein MACH09_46780 [Vibrio sp. MACH09]